MMTPAKNMDDDPDFLESMVLHYQFKMERARKANNNLVYMSHKRSHLLYLGLYLDKVKDVPPIDGSFYNSEALSTSEHSAWHIPLPPAKRRNLKLSALFWLAIGLLQTLFFHRLK